MLYIGTKIVVIGSNVKRKAGPRVGSLGFVVNIMTNNRMTSFGNVLICDAYILFTQYGFQKQQRYELKKVMVAIPRLINYSYSMPDIIKETIKFISTNQPNKLPFLMISPTITFTEKDLQHKVYCYILNSTLRYKLQNIAYMHNSKQFPNTERLHATLSEGTRIFLRVATTNLKPSMLKKLITDVFEKDNYILKEVLELILKLDVLYNITEQQSKIPKNKPIGDNIIFNSLFKPYEFRQCCIEYGKIATNGLIGFCAELSSNLVIEGSKVLNKHV